MKFFDGCILFFLRQDIVEILINQKSMKYSKKYLKIISFFDHFRIDVSDQRRSKILVQFQILSRFSKVNVPNIDV